MPRVAPKPVIPENGESPESSVSVSVLDPSNCPSPVEEVDIVSDNSERPSSTSSSENYLDESNAVSLRFKDSPMLHPLPSSLTSLADSTFNMHKELVFRGSISKPYGEKLFMGDVLLVPEASVSEELVDETFRFLQRDFKANIVIFVSGERCYINGEERDLMKKSFISMIQNTEVKIRVFSAGEACGPAKHLQKMMSHDDVGENIRKRFRLTNIVSKELLEDYGLAVTSRELERVRKTSTWSHDNLLQLDEMIALFDEMIVLDGKREIGYQFLDKLAALYSKKCQENLNSGGLISKEELEKTFDSTIRLALHLTSDVRLDEHPFRDLPLLSIETEARGDKGPYVRRRTDRLETVRYLERFQDFGKTLLQMMRNTGQTEYTDRDLYAELTFYEYFQGDVQTAVKILETTEHLNILIPLAIHKERLWFFDLLSRCKSNLVRSFVLNQQIIADLYKTQSDHLLKLRAYAQMEKGYSTRSKTDFETIAPIVKLLRLAMPDTFSSMYDDFKKINAQEDLSSEDFYNHLLMYACLNLKEKSIDYFWKQSKVGVAGTIAMIGIFQFYSETTLDYNSKVQAAELAQTYKQRCLKLLENCAISAVEETQLDDVCLKHSRFCGELNMSSVDMADILDFQEFIASEACQDVLKRQWLKTISSNQPHPAMYFVAAILPVFGLFFLRYTDEPPHYKWYHRMFHITRFHLYIHLYLKSPFSKFAIILLSTVIFVAYLSCMLLFGYTSSHSGFEYFLWYWQICLVGEEVAQIWNMVGTPWMKMRQYFGSIWNWIDILASITMLSAATFRILAKEKDEDFNYPATIFYVVSLLSHYIKLFHIFSLIEVLGPKIVIIIEMLKDVLVFMGILVVSMLGFGIGLQVLINGDSTIPIKDFGQTTKSIFDHTYWPIFGEIGGVVSQIQGDTFPDVDQEAVFQLNETLVLIKVESEEGNETFMLINSGFEEGNETMTRQDLEKMLLIRLESKESGKDNNTMTPQKLYRKHSRKFWKNPYRIATTAYFAIYIFVTNIVLLNLLIATFSNTFAKVQEKGDTVFKVQRFKYQREFHKRNTTLGPLYNPLDFLKWVMRKIQVHCLGATDQAAYDYETRHLDEATFNWQFAVKKAMLIRQMDQQDLCTCHKPA